MSERNHRIQNAAKPVFETVDYIAKPARANHSFEKAAVGRGKPVVPVQVLETPEYDRNRPDDIWYFRR